METWRCGCLRYRDEHTWWRWIRPAAEAAGIIRRWRCWSWRRACSARNLPDTWVDWNWRNWRRRWGATTTMRGSWWSGTITEAACWRTSEMPADTRRFTARGGD